MKKLILITILLFSAVLIPVYSLEGTALYESAIENYKSKQNEIALEQFLEFRNKNPENRKADDALWYIGRLSEKLNRIGDAETAFREVLEIKGSNRLAEAAYDLSQILYSRKNYLEVIELLTPLMELEEPDSYEVRSLEILGDSFYNHARSERSDFRDESAAVYFINAAEVYEFLLGFLEEEKDRLDTLYSLGKSYRWLAALGINHDYFDKYYEMSINALRESGTPRALSLLMKLEKSRENNYEVFVSTLGGFNNITSSPGFDLTADAEFMMPLGYNLEIDGGLKYSFDDFSFKTFNFDNSKTGDLRLIQSKSTISADISLVTGNSRNYENTIRLDADYVIAEDFGDTNYGLKISEDGLLRIDDKWQTGWDSEFAWKVFPDYMIGGHKIDSIQGDISPFLQWYFSDNSDVTLTYGLNIKQYLEAKYDTAVMGVDSIKDRQYITNSIKLDFDGKIGSKIDTGLYYELLYLESNNYDEWITDNSGTDKYMEDYNDYLQHTVKGSADIQWLDRLRTDFDGSVEIRNYTNYVARDSAGDFFAGDTLRSDLTLAFDAELGFIIWSNPSGAEAELIGQFWWDKSISNMDYEVSFDTNSDFFGGLLGVELRLP